MRLQIDASAAARSSNPATRCSSVGPSRNASARGGSGFAGGAGGCGGGVSSISIATSLARLSGSIFLYQCSASPSERQPKLPRCAHWRKPSTRCGRNESRAAAQLSGDSSVYQRSLKSQSFDYKGCSQSQAGICLVSYSRSGCGPHARHRAVRRMLLNLCSTVIQPLHTKSGSGSFCACTKQGCLGPRRPVALLRARPPSHPAAAGSA